MEHPIYRLEGVVHGRQEEMEDFVGPLDVILHLLTKNKIEIQDISIALLLDQYMDYLRVREEMDLEIASEFVTMAAHLMYIKSRMLLSIRDEEALSEMELLIRSLEERRRSESYAQIKGVSQTLAQMNETGLDIYVKPPERLPEEKEYAFHHEQEDLVTAMADVLTRSDFQLPPPLRAFDGIVGREPYPVLRKATEIVARLLRQGALRFRALFSGNRSRSEIVATFIAVLELCHARRILLTDAEDGYTVTPASGAAEGPLVLSEETE